MAQGLLLGSAVLDFAGPTVTSDMSQTIAKDGDQVLLRLHFSEAVVGSPVVWMGPSAPARSPR